MNRIYGLAVLAILSIVSTTVASAAPYKPYKPAPAQTAAEAQALAIERGAPSAVQLRGIANIVQREYANRLVLPGGMESYKKWAAYQRQQIDLARAGIRF